MSINRTHRTGGAAAILAAARAALAELPGVGPAAQVARGATATPGTAAAPRPTSQVAVQAQPAQAGAIPTSPTLTAPGPAPAGGATGRNTAQQNAAFFKTKPRPAGVKPRQIMAARLLLSGRGVAEVAGALGVHPYTVSRWKRDPRFEAELRRQVERATGRNTAQQNPTSSTPPAPNEPNRR